MCVALYYSFNWNGHFELIKYVSRHLLEAVAGTFTAEPNMILKESEADVDRNG